MSITLYLPNKNGNPSHTPMPKYIEEIIVRRIGDKDVPRIREVGPYRYRIFGYNAARPSYGIYADIEKFKKWCSRYFCELEDIVFHEERKNYYVEFNMYDPIAQQFEKAGLIRRM